MSTAIERLPLLSPAQNRLCPLAVTGQRRASSPPCEPVEADDVGAHLRQRHSGQRDGDESRALDDAHAGQDAGHQPGAPRAPRAPRA